MFFSFDWLGSSLIQRRVSSGSYKVFGSGLNLEKLHFWLNTVGILVCEQALGFGFGSMRADTTGFSASKVRRWVGERQNQSRDFFIFYFFLFNCYLTNFVWKAQRQRQENTDKMVWQYSVSWEECLLWGVVVPNYKSAVYKLHINKYKGPLVRIWLTYMLYCRTLPYLEFSVRQFGCVFLPQKETKVSFLRTVGVGGGGGGGKTRPLEKVLEVRHRGAAQPSVRSIKASVHILQTCIHAVNTKKFREKQRFMGMFLATAWLAHVSKKVPTFFPLPPRTTNAMLSSPQACIWHLYS